MGKGGVSCFLWCLAGIQAVKGVSLLIGRPLLVPWPASHLLLLTETFLSVSMADSGLPAVQLLLWNTGNKEEV